MRRDPALSLIAVLVLGLGIGLTAAMFSVVRSLALRGLPVPEGQRIVDIERRPHGATGEGWGVQPRDWVAWQEQQHTLEGLAIYSTNTVAVRVDRGAWRYPAAQVSANAFELLRVHAALGRTFRTGDDAEGADPVVVLGHDLWRDRFDSDPGAVGRTLFVDGVAHVVIGVMPAGFRFPSSEDLWLPFVIPASAVTSTSFPSFGVFARLAPGVSRRQASADFAVIAARLEAQYPATNHNMGVAIKSFTARAMGEAAIAQMLVILGAVGLVLLIACANVANLQLVRAIHRMRDLSVRASLGATRGRLMAQALTESTVLALLGAALGVLVALAATGGLRHWLTSRLPYWAVFRLDGMTLLFVMAVALGAGLLAGALPALKAGRASMHDALRDEARGSTGFHSGRAMQTLVVLEIALSLALMVATGLMLQAVRRVRDVRAGFAVDRTVTAQVTVPDAWDAAARLRFAVSLQTALTQAPGVATAVLASNLPTTRANTTRYALQGQAYDEDRAMPYARLVSVSPGFFEQFGAAARAGRLFDSHDGAAGEPVAIINQRLANTLFGSADPLGRSIRTGGRESQQPWRRIVGVVPNLWIAGLDAFPDRNPAGIYVPLAQQPPATLAIALQVRGETAAPAAAIREAVAALAPDVPVYDSKLMGEVIEDNSWFYGMAATLVGTCGVAAMLLATIGLYGVIAFTVGRRTREFGIRMAVGARPGSIVALVLRRGWLQTGIGMTLGFALAAVIGGGLSTLVFEVNPHDPVVFATFGLLLILVNMTATLAPALRAARIDPLQALRSE